MSCTEAMYLLGNVQSCGTKNDYRSQSSATTIRDPARQDPAFNDNSRGANALNSSQRFDSRDSFKNEHIFVVSHCLSSRAKTFSMQKHKPKGCFQENTPKRVPLFGIVRRNQCKKENQNRYLFLAMYLNWHGGAQASSTPRVRQPEQSHGTPCYDVFTLEWP